MYIHVIFGVTFMHHPRYTIKPDLMKTLFTAFALCITVSSMAQWGIWKKIEGNGHIKKETRDVRSGYTAISSSGSWDVMIAYGESNTIEVEGDENLLDYIDTHVEGSQLVIKTRGNYNLYTHHKIVVYVSVTRLTGIHLSGSGDIIGHGRFRNDGNTVFRTSGSGSIRIEGDHFGSVEAHVSGSGQVKVAGSASSLDASISGSGGIDCSKLIADNLSAHISGSGNIHAYANRSVDANISGSGNITYTGSATDIRKHVSGSGRVRGE